MAVSPSTGSDRDLLNSLEDLGSGDAFAGQIFALVGRSQFFAEFSRDDVTLFAGYMRVYRARPQQTVIREGETGDYMLQYMK